MKKLLFLMMLTCSIGIGAHAQDHQTKVKSTSTVPQKVHNAFSKHKKHKGYKVKHKEGDVTQKHKVDLKDGDVKNKTKK